jgi:hypothetical protein
MHAAAFSDKYIKGIDCQGPNVTNAKHLGFLGNHDNNQDRVRILGNILLQANALKYPLLCTKYR